MPPGASEWGFWGTARLTAAYFELRPSLVEISPRQNGNQFLETGTHFVNLLATCFCISARKTYLIGASKNVLANLLANRI